MRFFISFEARADQTTKISDIRDMRNLFKHPNGDATMGLTHAKNVVEMIYALNWDQTLKVEVTEGQMFAYLWNYRNGSAVHTGAGWSLLSIVAENSVKAPVQNYNATS